MSDPILLVVGLGNPGSKYDQTRHNAGFWFVDDLAQRYHGDFSSESRFSGELSQVDVGGEKRRLLKPMTFMNKSGIAVRQLIEYYKIPLQQVLVAYDEIDLPAGAVRLKFDGGHGGHNGLRDIFAHTGKDFWRLRLGVGHPGNRADVVNYVLGRPSSSDQALINEGMHEANQVVDDILAGNMDIAMNELHRKRS